MKYGFIHKNEDQEAYVFGGGMLPKEILQPDGQWDLFLPEYEPQYNSSFDTYGCPIFATLNAVEILEKRIEGGDFNHSERFHYNLIPLRPPGGDPHVVAESIRKNGVIDQWLLPMTESFGEYILPEPVPQDLLAKGLEWLEKWVFGHEYVWKGNTSPKAQEERLKEALRYSPVGASVSAWEKDADGLYIDGGRPNNHWCVIIGFRYREDGAFIRRVLDTYDHEIKELHPDHHIEVAKRYYLKKKVYNISDNKKANFASLLINLIKKISWIF